jgi:hypothetical protein
MPCDDSKRGKLSDELVSAAYERTENCKEMAVGKKKSKANNHLNMSIHDDARRHGANTAGQ